MTQGGTITFPEPVDDYYHKITPRLRQTDALGVGNLMGRVLFWFRGRSEPTPRSPVNTGDRRVWAHTQSAVVATTLMLSLTAHGYDSCPIGGLDKVRIRRLLGQAADGEFAGLSHLHFYYWWRVPFLVPAGLGLAFYFGPLRSLPLAILTHWLTGEIILFFLGIAELFGVA